MSLFKVYKDPAYPSCQIRADDVQHNLQSSCVALTHSIPPRLIYASLPIITERVARKTSKMTSKLSALVRRGTDYLTPSGSSANLPASYGDGSFTKARAGALFPTVDPAVDGEDCDYDCASCTVKYPAKFSIEEDDKLYGHVNGWATHLLVATGKTDWVRDVADEKGSVMEAVGKYGQQLKNGVCHHHALASGLCYYMSYDSRATNRRK